MIKFGKGVVKHRVLILIVAFALLIPSGISFINTRINFDILSYLPSQIETMKGQDIMVDEFGTGALSFVILEDMKDQDIETLADDIEDLKGVNDVIWYGTIADSTLPREAIPDEVYDAFNNKDANSQLMLVTYSDTMGSDETMEAVNKMDKHGANPDRIKQQLTEYGLVPEEWGGETIVCPISAKTGEGVDKLLENLVLLAEILELKANPNRAARGTVIEARMDKGRGPIMTVLVQNGTLHQGDIIIAGTAVGRVRTMTNDKGQRVTKAGPSIPVEIAGMSEVPSAGDKFNAVADERMARELVEERKQQKKDAANAGSKKVSLDDLFSRIQQGEMKDFNIIVKADVQGSAEAVKSSLEKLSNDEVRVQVIHSGVGAINESDVMLAATSNAIIVGFNVRPDAAARDNAARSNVEIRMYRVIYDCINEIEAAMKGMLAPKFQEQIIGHVEIRQTFKVSKVGTVCGGYVTDGKIVRNSKVRVVRDNIVVFEGDLASLRRFKDDVKEVAAGYECGLQVDKYNDVKVGDVIEVYVMEEIKQ